MFKVVSNVPVLKVGQSFVAPFEAVPGYPSKSKVATAAHVHGTHHGMKFVTRKTAKGNVRVWRVA